MSVCVNVGGVDEEEGEDLVCVDEDVEMMM